MTDPAIKNVLRSIEEMKHTRDYLRKAEGNIVEANVWYMGLTGLVSAEIAGRYVTLSRPKIDFASLENLIGSAGKEIDRAISEYERKLRGEG